MVRDVVTLTELLGEPDFQPPKRMDGVAEAAITAHIRSRRDGPLFPVTTDDLTTLIEKHAEVLDIYADLSEFGLGVEGMTLFQQGRKPVVKISTLLSDGASERRLRSTIAHEFGHVLLHDPLFQRRAQPSMFEDERRILQVCYRDDAEKPSLGDLFEYQAWFVCGAVLMPYTELASIVVKVAEANRHFLDIWQGSELGETIIGHASRIFDVSLPLARIRLLKAGLITQNPPARALF